MRFSYVLPDPTSYQTWEEFDGDLAAVKAAGYDNVELQIVDPAEVDAERLQGSLAKVGFGLCAFQSGPSYLARGNCLCTSDAQIRGRTVELMRSFVDFAAQFDAIIVFSSLQGRKSDEQDLEAGRKRVLDSLREIARYASERRVTIALEPIAHLFTAYHSTIESVAKVVRELAEPGLRMMVDTFSMNITERSMLTPLEDIADILAHVHLSETNWDILGTGHWDTAAFLSALDRVGYEGHCSIGVYNPSAPRRTCMTSCMEVLRRLRRD